MPTGTMNAKINKCLSVSFPATVGQTGFAQLDVTDYSYLLWRTDERCVAYSVGVFR
jgi:hypothetical protein